MQIILNCEQIIQKATKEQSFHTAQVYLDNSIWNQWLTLHRIL